MNKMSGLGLSVLTLVSVASLSSNSMYESYTSNMVNPYFYESVSCISDECGELCLSSDLSKKATGDVLSIENADMNNLLEKHSRKSIQIQITKISRHTSKFDFEEEYEEI